MGATVERPIARPVSGWARSSVVVGGLALLLARAFGPASIRSPGALLVLYGALLAMSVIASGSSVPAEAPPVTPALAAGLGAVAVVAVRLAAGPAIGAERVALGAAFGILAAVAEEAFFRRFLFERLLGASAVAAVLASAFLFAAIHVPAYGWGAFPVDLSAGLLFSWQRWASGSWLAPASTHALANLLAVIR